MAFPNEGASYRGARTHNKDISIFTFGALPPKQERKATGNGDMTDQKTTDT